MKCYTTTHAPPVPLATLEFGELLASFIGSINFQHIESHSLAQRSALSNGNLVTFLDTETGRDMCGEVLVTFLVSVVLLHVMKIVTTKVSRPSNEGIPNDDGTVHFGGNN